MNSTKSIALSSLCGLFAKVVLDKSELFPCNLFSLPSSIHSVYNPTMESMDPTFAVHCPNCPVAHYPPHPPEQDQKFV